MPWFTYSGIDSGGNEVSADEFAETENEVLQKLLNQGVSVLSIKPKAASGFNIDFSKLFTWVSATELKYFYVNMATLIDAGCTLRSSISSLADQTENQGFAKVLKTINQDIGSGKSFSEAVAMHPKVFSPLFINLVKAGEEGGMLDQILMRYASYTENQEKIKSRIRGALVLPAIMVLVSIGVVIGLLTYVFPTFMELFKGKEALLPTPTIVVMTVSDFIRHQYVTGIVGFIVISVITYAYLQTKMGWRHFSWFQLNVPLFGRLFRKAYVASFSHTLSALVKGGVPTLRALNVASGTISNTLVKEAVQGIFESVEKGGSFSAPMHQFKYLFPSMVILMIQVGETSGKFDFMLEKVGTFFDAEVDEAVSAILTSIEPILTVIMGFVVLTIAGSMFLPLFNIGQILK